MPYRESVLNDVLGSSIFGAGADGAAAERVERGRRARAVMPRSGLGELAGAIDRVGRPDPVQTLTAQEVNRVPALVPLRHARMAASPFAFYRGAAAIMADDLGSVTSTGLTTQLCGDAHLANFGLFAAPDRSLVFDVNDFDETNPGPFEWDVFRLVTSFAVAAKDNGFSHERIQRVVSAAIRGYRDQMHRHARTTELDSWYARINERALKTWAETEGRAARSTLTQSVKKAERRDVWSAVDSMTIRNGDRRELIEQPPTIIRIPLDSEAAARLEAVLHRYATTLAPDRAQLLSHYQIADFGHKIVGVGSVGLMAMVVIMQGRSVDDILVLQAKEAVSSVLEPYSGASRFDEHGRRVVVGQQVMQAASDVFLGWVQGAAGRSFYIRQLRDKKYAPDATKMKPKVLADYAALCGRALARAHARAGDSIALDAYMGKSQGFEESMTAFAVHYARGVRRDFDRFTEAIADGALAVSTPERERGLRVLVDDNGALTVAEPR